MVKGFNVKLIVCDFNIELIIKNKYVYVMILNTFFILCYENISVDGQHMKLLLKS